MQFRCAPVRALLFASLIFCTGMAARAQGAPAHELLTYAAEWRFLRAGEVEMKLTGASQSDLKLRTVGLVSKLIPVSNTYRGIFDPGYCALTALLESHEGKKNRETKVSYDRERKRVSYFEKDLDKDAVIATKEMDIPSCVHDVTGALQKLRELKLEPVRTIELPVSDGKKVISARVDSLEKEKVTTPLGEFATVKYEAFLFNGVLYRRKGRLFVWLTDDEKRIPVQIRIQLPFYVGTVTLQLEKIERK